MAPARDIESRVALAMRHHRAGETALAQRMYHEVLAFDPNRADALYLLGLIDMESGRLDAAAERFGRSAILAPDNPAYHANLGEAHRRLGHVEAATEAFLVAMALRPELVAPVFNLGLLLAERDEMQGAVACFCRAAALAPALPGVAPRLAAARAAREMARDAPRGAPSAARAKSLAAALRALALLEVDAGRREEALALLRRAIELEPGSAAAHCNAGVIQAGLSRIDEAAASYRRAIELEPALSSAHHNLGNALVRGGLLSDAIASYRAAVESKPDSADYHSALVYYLQFHPGYDPPAILEEARRWNERHAQPLAAGIATHANDRNPDRRLRIGYVSPDFRLHCQAMFMFPLLAHHEHQRFEIFCYSDVARPDDWTTRLLGHADQTRSLVGMSDSAAAGRIRDDRIDVLVDLTMHMDRNRLPMFARKPAPIQISWLAYPGTTGMTAIDYRVTDPFLDPPAQDPGRYAERSLRMPNTFWCYHPLTSEEAVSPLPARARGSVRFGCLNNFFKVNAEAIALWARVLQHVEGSTLVLLAPPGAARKRTLDAFEACGVDGGRVEFVDHQSRLRYLATYRSIDVCLDTFPYNGHTTSLDALWMGVPVVTLVGATVVGRAGLCHAMNLGLPELVATTADEYVRAAVGLCADLDRLADLRAGLRARIEKSPLMDAPRFARNLEAAYRRAWHRWCGHVAPTGDRGD